MERALPWLAAGVCLLLAALASPFTVDDAYVVARYAANLVEGHGYVMNVGAAPTDGVTGPLWLVPFVMERSLGIAPMTLAKSIGAICAAGSIALVGLRARRASLSATPFVCVIAVSQATLCVWGVAGLETGLATLLFTAASLAATARPAPRRVALGLCVAALAWLRPDLALACAALLAHRVSGQSELRPRNDISAAPQPTLHELETPKRRTKIADLRGFGTEFGLSGFVLGALGALSVVAFRYAMFGDLVPLAIHAKPSSIEHGVPYVGIGALVATSGVGALLVFRAARRSRRHRVLAVAMLVHLATIAVLGGDWMPGFRMLAPIAPIYALVAGSELARIRGAAAVIGTLAVLALPLVDLTFEIVSAREAGAHRRNEGAALARTLRGPVALVDVGYLPFERHLEVIDLGGLTDPHVAHAEGGHLAKEIDVAYLEARRPATILLHAASDPEIDSEGHLVRLSGFPVERRLAAMPWVRARFRATRIVRYAPGYVYVVLEAKPL